jgi:hypothetical protein
MRYAGDRGPEAIDVLLPVLRRVRRQMPAGMPLTDDDATVPVGVYPV